jgi:hypothetical protein
MGGAVAVAAAELESGIAGKSVSLLTFPPHIHHRAQLFLLEAAKRILTGLFIGG